MLAKLVGEGYERPNAEGELPLDVNYSKVAEWMVGRKLLPQDWNRKLQAVQAKAAEAAKDLPPGFLSQFDGGDGAPVDYFLSKKILGKLTETAERSLLGSLKGSAAGWERVVRAYESSMLHAAEAGMILARNADYELPYLRKQGAKHQQAIADLERRQAEALKSAAAAADDFRQECAQLGLNGAAVGGGAAALRAGVAGLTARLPELMADAVAAAKAEGVGDAVAYYAAFTTMGQRGSDAAAGAAAPVQLLPTLVEVREGRTEAAAPGSSSADVAHEAGGAQVEWDVGGGAQHDAHAVGGGGEEEAGNGMSWDLDAPAEGESGGIEWGAEGEPAAAGQAPGDGLGPAPMAAVSWDIDVSGAGDEMCPGQAEPPHAAGDGGPRPSQQSGASAVASDASPLPAAPPDVQRLCSDAAYRARLLDDLLELRAFLLQRRAELSSRGLEPIPASAPADVAAVGAEGAGALLAAVDAAVGGLTAERVVRLASLAGSAHHRERLVASLLRRAGQQGKFERAAAEAAARRAEVQRQLVADSARAAALLRRTAAVKAGAEAALAARLGRPVNVQGEINAQLAAAPGL